MKRIVIALTLITLVASVASAEVLQTAGTLGQGKWGAVLGYASSSNYANVSGGTLAAYGGYIGYGLTSNMDLELKVGSGTGNGLGATLTGTQLGLVLKYGILKEGKTTPVSVAALVGYQSSTSKLGGVVDVNSSEIGIGIGVSKVMAPLVPYASIAYKQISSDTATSKGTQMDLNVGTAIAWSANGAVFLEATSQSLTPSVGAAYTQTQIALGVGVSM